MIWLLITAICSLAAGGLIASNARARRARFASWETRKLVFGRDLDGQSATGFMHALSGLHSLRPFTLDVVASNSGISSGITHYLSAQPSVLGEVTGMLAAHIPRARLAELTETELAAYTKSQTVLSTGLYGRIAGRHKVLAMESPERGSLALLSALQPLARGEVLSVRLILAGAPKRALAVKDSRGKPVPGHELTLHRKRADYGLFTVRMSVSTGQIAKASQVRADKTNTPNVAVLPGASSSNRTQTVLARVNTVWRSRATRDGFINTIVLRGWLLRLVRNPGSWLGEVLLRSVLGSDELLGLAGFPFGSPLLDGVMFDAPPRRKADRQIPASGRIFGTSTWPQQQTRVLAQPVVGGLSHTLIAGPSGVGKSTLLANLISQDIQAGRGCILIDGKGDAFQQILARIPPGRLGDVTVLDCTGDQPMVGLALFGHGDPSLAADVVLSVFADLFRNSWGPLSKKYLRAGLVAVASTPGGTLADVPFIFTDSGFRRRCIQNVSDPLTRSVLELFDQMKPGEQAQQVAAPLGKLSSLLGRPVIRNILGQPEPKLDFGRVLARGEIVLLSTNAARIGSGASRLIAAVTLHCLFRSVQARLTLDANKRTPFFVYVDEVKALGDLPMPLDSLLEQARGLGVGLTLAPQSVSQLRRDVAQATLTNAATRIVFRQNHDDAALLARDLRGITPEDLLDLGQFEAVARIALGNGLVCAPATIATAALPPVVSDPNQVRADSLTRNAVSLTEVDNQLAKRRGDNNPGETVFGRAERSQP